jgi:hypothetical protein
MDDVKTGGSSLLRDKLGGRPDFGLSGILIFTRSGGHLSKLGMIRAEVMDGEYSTGIHG